MNEQQISKVIAKIEETLYYQHSFILPPDQLVELKNKITNGQEFHCQCRLKLDDCPYLSSVEARIDNPHFPCWGYLKITAEADKNINKFYSFSLSD
ncbi:MAG TPA: hypothetical protein V6D33_12030 [Cyanophyceae cyanobacterium]